MKSVVIDKPGKVRLHEIAEPRNKSNGVLPEIQMYWLGGSGPGTCRGFRIRYFSEGTVHYAFYPV